MFIDDRFCFIINKISNIYLKNNLYPFRVPSNNFNVCGFVRHRKQKEKNVNSFTILGNRMIILQKITWPY